MYKVGATIVGLPVFIGCWIYCVVQYGFMLGVVFGWIPSAIVAAIAGALWPVFAIGGVWIALHYQ